MQIQNLEFKYKLNFSWKTEKLLINVLILSSEKMYFDKRLTLNLMSLNWDCTLIALNSLHLIQCNLGLTYWWPYKVVCIEESKNCSGWMGVHKLGNDSLMMAKIPSEAHINVSHPASYNRHPCAHNGVKGFKKD